MSRRTIVMGLGAWGTIGALFAAVASPVCAQTYTQSTFTQGMTNLSSPTVLWSANGQDEVVSGSIAIGFTFNFYGNAYTTCIISPNGYIRFGSSTNQTFGGKMWDLVSGEGGWRNFEWDAPATFTWGETSTRLFVPCSNTSTSAGAGTISSVGTTVTGVGTSFAATDVGNIIQSGGQLRTILSVNVVAQTLTTDTAFSPALTNAAYSFGATQQVVVRLLRDGTSEPNVVDAYWQALEEAAAADECMGLTTDNGGDGANITYCLKDGLVVYNRKRGAANNYGAIRHCAKLPSYPVALAQRIWGTNYVLVGVDGGVHKIFDNIGSDTDPKNGCLAATGEKVVPDDNSSNGIQTDSSQSANTKDLDWPLACAGKPVGSIWVRQKKIYWITDQGYLYGYNWNWWGDSLATGDETAIPGYPLNFGSPIRSMYVMQTKLIVGLDNGAVVEVKP